ncbi:D-hexose-6-phosphate mutarotase [Gulosibacter macacae]|uniref:glucose-6-phosphate 1-epimerase n=1 Tax=Gulosibacter macacae TaxID=2488791 RepID=A0A3P3VT28_9MICO|nr:D-hexose-6-phosphate mutarotase [Gulosibacter macacae]RRJ85962.1 D-hexose-6-phosphate mutarotase [Gulosibacter macacae]
MSEIIEQLVRGAHVTAWQPAAAAHPVLFSSSIAESSATRAWRGGVPICAPWFATGPDGSRSPSHGPARTAVWQVLEAPAGQTRHRLVVDTDAAGRAAQIELEFATARDGASLEVALTARNLGDAEALVEAALHSYFAVSDVTAIEVRGLEQAPFFDKVAGAPAPAAARIEFGGLVDRIYESVDAPIEIVDAGWSRTLRIEREGAAQAVVWNCGPDAAPGDLGPGEWRGFVCVEAAMLGDAAVTLAPEATHRLVSRVTVVS